MNCDHEWVEEEEPEDWPIAENGHYLRCIHCGKWGLLRTIWEEDYEIPKNESDFTEDLIILTPKGWMEESGG